MSTLSSENSWKTEFENRVSELVSSLEDSSEWRQVRKAVSAVKSDPELSKLLKEIDEAQALCRVNEKNPALKRGYLDRLEKLKSELYSDPLWINFVSAYREARSLAETVKGLLEER